MKASDKSSDKTLLAEVVAFIKARGMTETGFGRRAVKDPNLVDQLRAGRSPTGRTVDRIKNFMRDYRD